MSRVTTSLRCFPNSRRLILILSSHLRLYLASFLFLRVFPPKSYTHLSFSPMRATRPTRSIPLRFIA